MAKEMIKEERLHIAMFPWLAFGHIFPFLEVAKLIGEKGHKVSFISTPRNIDRIIIPPNLSPLITFVKLPLPSVHGLPSGAEATSDLPHQHGQSLKKAHDLLRDPMGRLLGSLRPDWILFDYAPFWLPELARIAAVRSPFFSIFPASCLGFMGCHPEDYRRTPEDFTVAPRWVPFPSTVAFRKFQAERQFYQLRSVDGVSVVSRFSEVLRGCDVVAVRSSWELESDYLRLLRDLLHKPVVPVGQLPPATPPPLHSDMWREIEGWLGEQGKGSVVYVAFGSEAEWSDAELAEIALGLDLSGLPFFWVLRGSEPRLPDGFEERVGRRGYVCRRWAPQVEILGHDSVGAFLSHSGWSSVVEALQFSRPLVLLPFSNDQGLNVKILEERTMGFAVPRDESDGSFTRDAVADSLFMVVKGEEGKVYRGKAKEVSAMFGDREIQDKYVDEFLAHLKTHAGQHLY